MADCMESWLKQKIGSLNDGKLQVIGKFRFNGKFQLNGNFHCQGEVVGCKVKELHHFYGRTVQPSSFPWSGTNLPPPQQEA